MATISAGAEPARTILIVDDRPANLGVVVDSLDESGFRVVVAQEGREALERADYVKPDLVLLDVSMPGMDGFEVCRRLKSREGTRDIPVIFMTARTETEDKVAGFAAGGVDYVTKPLQVQEVIARVNTHLSVRSMQKQLEIQNALLQREIEEHQRAEQELSALNKDLEAFTYSVSHDLRAPLRAISGFTQLLQRRNGTQLDAAGRELLDRVMDAGRHMDILIHDLLQYSRTGKGNIRMEPVPLSPLLRRLGSIFGERIAAARAQLEIVEPLATPHADPMLLEQILTNLVDNALKYRCREGVPSIRVSCTEAGGQVVLRVADNGIGIKAGDQERIFEAFRRLHTQDEYDGTGIGLAIVAKSARVMGGIIEVESEPGRGSTFSVRLPASNFPQGR
jgi:signal transduction histidine kinase